MPSEIVKNYSANEIILDKGDIVDTAYYIKKGSVILSSNDFEEELSFGKTFGEVALIVPNSISQIKVVAKEETSCQLINVNDFLELTSGLDPFLSGIFRVLVNKLKSQDNNKS